jgi:serine/threonine protein kinase
LVSLQGLLITSSFTSSTGAGIMADDCRFLVLEFCSRGSLLSLLKDKQIELPRFLRLDLALNAAKGLEFLHSLKPSVVHRDIKSPNVLVSEGWIAKIADFGSLKLLEALPSRQRRNATSPAFVTLN